MMTDMLYKATKYMNFEDAMTSRGGKTKKKERQDNLHSGKQALAEDNNGLDRQALAKGNEPSRSSQTISLIGDRIK